MDHLPSAARGLAAAAGQALRAATAALSLRPAAKPLHPSGAVVRAVLRRSGSDVPTGAAWLDEAGQDEVLVRLSRAVGLPDGVPDIHGLAMRIPTGEGRHGDLLLASTGRGRVTRFTLTVSRSPWGRPMTTLLPYRTPTGPILISAVHSDEHAVELSWARPAGTWRPFADLSLPPDAEVLGDAAISFDPVANTLPGLENYDWVDRLRAPAYVTARRARDAGEGSSAATP